ncbi:MAG: hypothetical protein PHC61_19125 [Chitinivibrionales bacterium]|nr:hypothetical protein [Chitinivibrionales bacterium]
MNIRLVFILLTAMAGLSGPALAQGPAAAKIIDPAKEEENYYRAKMGFVTLAGDQESDYPKDKYLVTQDVVIKKGTTMTIYPGAQLFFKKDTRIIIEGKLVCQGTEHDPITFRKLGNRDYFNPIDSAIDTRWEGVFVADSGELELTHTAITDTKYGISVHPDFSNILLDTLLFRNNKYQNLKIGNTIIPVPSMRIVCYKAQPEKISGVLGAAAQKKSWKPPVRIAGAGAGIIGAVVWAAGYAAGTYYHKKYNSETNPRAAVDYGDKMDLGAQAATAGLIVFGAGALGFSLTFVF